MARFIEVTESEPIGVFNGVKYATVAGDVYYGPVWTASTVTAGAQLEESYYALRPAMRVVTPPS